MKKIGNGTSIINHRGVEIRTTPVVGMTIRPRGRSWWRGPVVAVVHVKAADGSFSNDFLAQRIEDGRVTLVSRFGSPFGLVAEATAEKAAMAWAEFRDEFIARREGRWVEQPAA